MITFNVDDVKVGKISKFEFDSKQNLTSLIGIGLEATSAKEAITFNSNNFIAAINTAYDDHLPLILSPDMIWLVIAQGLSQHINNNAEELRYQFVSHEGKEKIEVFEDDFIKGNADNDWPHMFGQFSKAISKYIGKKRDLIVGDFSTTGPVEQAAHEIVLMESMQKYFSYEMSTCCGIPEITLLGSKEDWVNIQNRVRAISEFGLWWWTQVLEPIVSEFVNAASGNVNKTFWKNIYKIGGGSGGPYISGWIVNLFPYLKDYNTRDFTLKNTFDERCTTRSFPIGLAKVPFIWNYFSSQFNMEIAGGFTGLIQDESDSIIPQVGWAIRDTESHIGVSAIIEADNWDKYNWEKREKVRENFSLQLKQFGWENIRDNYTGSKNIIGSLPKNQIEAVKTILGLKFNFGGKNGK